MHVEIKTIHIFVQIEHQKEVKVDLHSELVTVGEIKTAAHVPADFALAVSRDGRLEALRDDQTIEVKEGEHFVAVPSGHVS